VVGLLLVRGARAQPPPVETIVFVSAASGELDASLHDALTAQLSGSRALLVFEQFATNAPSLRGQVAEARTLAVAHHAVGVFWLDAQTKGDWLVYLAEPAGERVLVRRMEVEPNGVAAAVETVAVITRQSSDALLAGQKIGMQPVELPPEPGPAEEGLRVSPRAPGTARLAPGPRNPAGSRARGPTLSFAYYGDSVAREVRWQSGIRLGAGYRWGSGIFVGAGYVQYREAAVESPTLAFQIARVPLDAEIGLSFGHSRLVPGVELRGGMDVIRRHVVSAVSPLLATPDASRVVVSVSPRVRLDYSLSPVLGTYLDAGADFVVNGFSFVSRVDGQDRPLLSPLRIRPAVELGLTFWP
jgi:hypothetical protein